MNMRATTLAVLLLPGCSSMPPRLQGQAIDAPTAFQVVDLRTGATRPVAPDASCESPLTDPRNGTRLTLARSRDGFGDYQPDSPRYGLARNELLRVDCRTGAAVGRVTAE